MRERMKEMRITEHTAELCHKLVVQQFSAAQQRRKCCKTLQQTVLQHTATNCNTLQRTATQ